MRKVQKLHREAMGLVDKALSERLKGRETASSECLRLAYQKERDAACLLERKVGFEPTRSVLYRSAASLAMECGEIREAERLVASGLQGNPPADIAEELRDLLEDVYFSRHLELRGISLMPGEVQMAVEGPAVGFGITSSSHFLERIKYVEAAVYRTAERILRRPFREGGSPKQALKNELELYLSVPRAASFAVTLKVGRGEQLRLPTMDVGSKVIDEMLECLELLEDGKTEELKSRIPDTAYYRNFVALAQNIAPDGEQVRTVGFTVSRKNIERKVALRKLRAQGRHSEAFTDQGTKKRKESIQIQGTLRFADALKQKEGIIQVIDRAGAKHRVRVPEGMMSDIVKPLWDCEVLIIGYSNRKTIFLEDIQKFEK